MLSWRVLQSRYHHVIGRIKDLVQKVYKITIFYGLNVNTNKTKFLVFTKLPNSDTELTAANQPIESLYKYNSLRSTINENVVYSVELKVRIRTTQSFHKIETIFRNKILSKELEAGIPRCYIFASFAGYSDYGHDEVFEMWLHRRIVRISCTDVAVIFTKSTGKKLRKKRAWTLK